MTPKELRDYCLAKPGAWPDEPWEGDSVAKVGSKIFAFLGSEIGRGEVRRRPARRPTSGWPAIPTTRR